MNLTQILAEHKSVSKVCRILKISRSTLYYQNHREKNKIYPYEKEIKEMFKRHISNYGRRRIQKALEREGIKVSQYIITKVLKKYDLEAKFGRRKLAKNIYTKPLYEKKNLLKEADENKKVYSADFSYVTYKGGKAIVGGLIDIKTKVLVGFSISKTHYAKDIKKSIEKAFKEYGVPDIVHTDGGSEYIGEEVHKYIIGEKAEHSISRPYKPNDNQYIESFWHTMKTEIGTMKRMTYEEVEKVIEYYVHYYNNIRLHSSIGYIPPMEMARSL